MNHPLPEKKKYTFNFIDVLLIVVILAAAALLVFFFKERRIVVSDQNEKAEIVYQLEISPMREEFRNLVEIGDTVTDGSYLLPIGEVTDVAYSPCFYIGFNKELGEQVSSDFPGNITMTVTVKAEAEITETGFAVNGRELILDQTFPFRVPDFTGIGKCISVTTVQNDNRPAAERTGKEG